MVLLVEVLDDEEVGERIIWPPAAMEDVDGAGSDAMDNGPDNGSDFGPSRDEVDAFACFVVVVVVVVVVVWSCDDCFSGRPALCQNSWSDSSIGDGIR